MWIFFGHAFTWFKTIDYWGWLTKKKKKKSEKISWNFLTFIVLWLSVCIIPSASGFGYFSQTKRMGKKVYSLWGGAPFSLSQPWCLKDSSIHTSVGVWLFGALVPIRPGSRCCVRIKSDPCAWPHKETAKSATGVAGGPLLGSELCRVVRFCDLIIVSEMLCGICEFRLRWISFSIFELSELYGGRGGGGGGQTGQLLWTLRFKNFHYEVVLFFVKVWWQWEMNHSLSWKMTATNERIPSTGNLIDISCDLVPLIKPISPAVCTEIRHAHCQLARVERDR